MSILCRLSSFLRLALDFCGITEFGVMKATASAMTWAVVFSVEMTMDAGFSLENGNVPTLVNVSQIEACFDWSMITVVVPSAW